jgi:hypothetical protein
VEYHGLCVPFNSEGSKNDADGCQYTREARMVPGSRNAFASRNLATQSTLAHRARSVVVAAGGPRVTAGGSPHAQ